MSPLRCFLGIGWTVIACGTASPQETTRVSVNSRGVQGNGHSYASAISADGRYVVFQSFATNLVPHDYNHHEDIFVHDRVTSATERVNVDSNGIEANDDSYGGPISTDGRFVAFFSWASNLVVGDTNNMGDIFVHDRVTGITELVSVSQNGGPGDGESFAPAISGDGRFVAFSSSSSDLVPVDMNNYYDVFVRDRQLGTTELVSSDSSGVQEDRGAYWPAISTDGMIVTFSSDSTNLVPGDTNFLLDVFVHDRSIGSTERVSIDSSGNEADGDSNYPSISADGQVVVFESWATNLSANDGNLERDIFVHDRASGVTDCASLDPSGSTGNDASRGPAAVSSDGRFVAFPSNASDLVPNDTNNFTDSFVRDRATGITERVSVDSSGNEGNAGGGGDGVISANGETVAFFSGSTNLVPNDTNGFVDAFVRDRCDAIWLNYGDGFPGTNGVPNFTSQADPVLGSTLTLDLDNSYGSTTFGLLFVGLGRAEIPTTWGGELLVAPLLTFGLALPAGVTTIFGQIPNDPSLCQLAIDLQAFEADPGAAKGVSFTRGLELVLGY
jgi:Tol biopolymer transport system component